MVKKIIKYVEAALKFFYLVLLIVVLVFMFLAYDYSKHIINQIILELFK